MNANSKIRALPIFTAVLGAIAMILHLGMMLWGRDEKGLLISAHPLAIALWAVTALAAVVVLLSVRKLNGSAEYGDNFAPSTAAAIGAFALAGGITVSVISGWNVWNRMDMIRSFCGILAIPALIVLGLKRFSGKQPFFGLHGLVCLYLTLHTVSHYQIWSSRPQLLNWFFPMAASIALALFSYHQTAFDAAMGNRRMQLGTGLLAAFFCISAAVQENGMLYLGGAVWALTNLCSLNPKKEDDHASA